MFKLLRCTFALIVAVMLIGMTVSSEAAKKTIAVMPLENVSGYPEQRVAEIMTEQLCVVLANSGNYNVVERAQMSKIMNESGFQSVAGDPNSTVKAGKLLGANYSLIGKVTMAEVINTASNELKKHLFGKSKNSILMHPFRGKISLDFRFVNNETGETIFAATVEGSKSGKTTESALHAACKNAAENALKEIQSQNPFSAKIVAVEGNLIYIDQGNGSGLFKDETLIIFKEGNPIIVDDKIVGMVQKNVGSAKVIEVNAEYSICKVIDYVENIKKDYFVKRRK